MLVDLQLTMEQASLYKHVSGQAVQHYSCFFANRYVISPDSTFLGVVWVVCARPLNNDEHAVQHYYLKNDRQAVEHYQRTADAGRLSRTCHFNLARNS